MRLKDKKEVEKVRKKVKLKPKEGKEGKKNTFRRRRVTGLQYRYSAKVILVYQEDIDLLS